jgi:hypothetical protein
VNIKSKSKAHDNGSVPNPLSSSAKNEEKVGYDNKEMFVGKSEDSILEESFKLIILDDDSSRC